MTESQMLEVEVGSAVAPDGQLMVLLQIPNGYLLMAPAGARELAGLLVEVAAEVEAVNER